MDVIGTDTAAREPPTDVRARGVPGGVGIEQAPSLYLGIKSVVDAVDIEIRRVVATGLAG